MKNLYVLESINNIPHINCMCKNVFPVYFNKVKVSYHQSINLWEIKTDCPICLMTHTFCYPDEFFSEYLNIVFQTITFNFKSHQEAVDYFVSYCKMNQVLESS